jgi:arginyl-tRNA synthetase
MRLAADSVRNLLAKKVLASILNKLSADFPNSEKEIAELFVEPPNTQLGDLALGCFIIAKSLKKNPAQVATELKGLIALDQDIIQLEAAGPYLNFKLSSELLGREFLSAVRDGSFFKKKLTEKNPRTMIEYSQPNTHKEIHVGHMRNASLGDAIVRLLKYCGYDVVSTTFPGDVGTHVAKCLWYLKYKNTEPIPSSGKGEWLGRLYSKGNLLLEDELGTPKEAENREKLTQILKQLEHGAGEYFELWKQTRQWSVDLMEQVYQWAGISFDTWYWESTVDATSVQYVKQLKAEGKLIESQGAVGMDLETEKLGFCMLLKSDGNGLYATKDIELAKRKFLEHKIEKSIYVVDVRQELHFKQVFKVLEKLGFEQAKNCFHLKYNFVELPDGAMSSRKGNIVPLMELVHKMEQTVKDNYLSRYRGEWTDSEIDLVAAQVAKGAIKFGMLRMDTNKKIVFDMEEWLKLEGESGPFVQYSCARIHSLLRKLGTPGTQVQWNTLNHAAERNLISGLMSFQNVVLGAAENYKPHLLTTYLYETAKRFNLFYHECSIGNAETEDLKQARLALSQATGLVLAQGLALLGIPVPDRM